MKLLTEEEFDKEFTVIEPPSGEAYWEYNELENTEGYVWTAADGEDGESIYLTPGYHIVNKIGYIVTEETNEDEEMQVHWYNPEEN